MAGERIHYTDPSVNLDAQAQRTRAAAERIAQARTKAGGADAAAATQADRYTAALERAAAMEREAAAMATGAAEVVARTTAQREAAAAAVRAETAAIRAQVAALREQAAAVGSAAAPVGGVARRALPVPGTTVGGTQYAAANVGRAEAQVAQAREAEAAAATQAAVATRQAANSERRRASTALVPYQGVRESYWSQATYGPGGYAGAGGAGGALPPGGGAGGGGGGYPPRPPFGPFGPAPGGGSGGAGGNRDYNETLRQQAEREARLAQMERDLGQARSFSGSQLAGLSNDTRRYGALTSEFFTAAARGEVTIKELGYQLGITAAKFGGWTAAATAIFGVIGAIRELAKGAIDAQSSVATLQRFVPNLDKNAASKGLQSVSQDLIEPIGQVGEATAAFARVTHNLPDALTAARVSILATKLDNISLADSQRYLTALVQEGGYQWSKLPQIFDQVSGAQRNMGARAGEVLPALAKSVGAVTAQGGDLSQLIALIGTAQITTGQTGNLIGTAMARGAANFYNQPKNVAVERALGVDTSLGFTQRLRQAVNVGTDLGPQQRQDLSRAFFGPLRGGLLTGLFRQGPTLERALNVTSPGATAGSTMQEFNDQSQRADYQIKRLSVSTQNLGATLARVGLLKPFAGMLGGLNVALEGANSLANIFGKLPSPIRDATLAIGTFSAAVFALQRIGGGSLLQRLPIARTFYDPAVTDKRLLVSGLRENVTGSEQAAVAAARQAQQKGFTAQGAQTVLAQRNAELASLEAQRAVATNAEEAAALDQQIAVAKEAQAKAEATATAATRETTVAAKEAALQAQVYGMNQMELATTQKMSAAEATKYGAAQGFMIRKDFKSPTSDPLKMMTEMGLSEEEAAAMAAQMSQLQMAATRFGTTGGEAMSVGERVSAKVSSGVGRIKSGVSRLGQAASAFGPLDAAFAALIGIPIAIGVTNSYFEKLHQQIAAMKTPDTAGAKDDLKTLDDQLKKLEQQRKDIGPAVGTRSVFSGHAGQDLVQTLGATVDDAANFFGFGKPFDVVAKHNKAVQENLNQQNIIKAQQPYTGLETQINQLVKGSKTKLQATLAYQTGLDTINYLAASTKPPTTPGAAEAAQSRIGEFSSRWQAAIIALRTGGRSISNALRAAQQLDPSQVANLSSRVQDYVGLYGVDPTAKQMATSVIVRGRAAIAAASPRDRAKVMHDVLGPMDNAESAIITQAQQDFQAALTEAGKSVSRIRAARSRYLSAIGFDISGLKAALRAANQDQRRDMAGLRQAEVALQQAKNTLESIIAEGFGQIFKAVTGMHMQNPALTQVGAAVASWQAQLKGDIKTRNELIAGLGRENHRVNQQTIEATKQANEAIKQAQGPASQDPFEMTRLRGELAKAQAAGDPVRQAQIDEDIARQELGAARNEKERIQARIDLANAENAYNDAVQQMADLRAQIAEAQSSFDPIQQAAIAENAAAVAMANAHGQQQYLQAELNYVQAQNQMTQAIEEAAQARFDYLKSLTTDPVKQAEIDVQKAQQAVSFDATHGGLTTAKAYQDRAALNNSRQALVAAHIQDREDTIDFRLKMNEISNQTAIQEYQALLGVHGITKQLRRQVLERIKELKDSGSQDFAALDLGSIRLPTPYDIRRSVEMIRQQGAASVFQQNTAQIHVYDSRDADRVGVQLESFIGGTGRSLARAAGTRG